MKRLLVLAAIALALALSVAPAFSQALAPPGPFSVVAYGAKSDPAFDSAPAFEAAIRAADDSLRRASPGEQRPSRLVRVPAGYYRLSRSVFVSPGLDVVGDGKGSLLALDGIVQGPALVYGVPDPACTAADRPDLFGLLDATAAPARGVRRGLSTRRGLSVQAIHSDMNLGRYRGLGRDGMGHDYWEGVASLAVDLAVVTDGPLAPGTPVCGLGRSGGTLTPRPWVLCASYDAPGRWMVSYQTSDRPGEGDGPDGSFDFPVPDRGLVRASWYLDLAAGTAAVAVNGVWIEVRHISPGPGKSLRHNDDWPLNFGRVGFNEGVPAPLTLCGLWTGVSPRYAAGKPGDPQFTPDGRPPTDAYRYFTDGPGLVGYLPLTDPVAARWLQTLDGRRLPNYAPISSGVGSGSRSNRLRGLSIQSKGSGVWVGGVLDWTADRVYIDAGAGPAVGTVPVVASYPIRVRDCTFSSEDTCWSGFGQLVTLDGVNFSAQGRDAVRARGCSITLRDPFLASTRPNSVAFVQFLPDDYGSSLVIRDAILDTEDTGYKVAPVVAWQRAGAAARTVSIDGLYVAKTSQTPGQAVVVLRPWPAGGGPVDADLRGLVVEDGAPWVASEGRWRVTRPQPDRTDGGRP